MITGVTWIGQSGSPGRNQWVAFLPPSTSTHCGFRVEHEKPVELRVGGRCSVKPQCTVGWDFTVTFKRNKGGHMWIVVINTKQSIWNQRHDGSPLARHPALSVHSGFRVGFGKQVNNCCYLPLIAGPTVSSLEKHKHIYWAPALH